MTTTPSDRRTARLQGVLEVGVRNRVRPLPPDRTFDLHRDALNRTIDRLGGTPNPQEALELAVRTVERQVTNAIGRLSLDEIKDALLWYSVLEARYLLSDSNGREEIETGIDGRYTRALRHMVELGCALGTPGNGLGAEGFCLLWVRLAFLELLLLDSERVARHGDRATLDRDDKGWVLSVTRDLRPVQAEIRADEAALGEGRHADFVERILQERPVLAELSAAAGFAWDDAAAFFLDCEQLALDRGGMVGVPAAEFTRIIGSHGINGASADAFLAAFVLDPQLGTEFNLGRLHRYRQRESMALAPFVRIDNEVLWSFGPVIPALCANVEYAVTGKHPRWNALGPKAADFVNGEAKAFERQVSGVLEAIPGVVVRSAIKKPLGEIPAPPREIDALCWLADSHCLLVVEAKNFLGLPDLAGWRQARSRTADAERQLDDQVKWARAHAAALTKEVFGAATSAPPTVVALATMPTKSAHGALDGRTGRWPLASVTELRNARTVSALRNLAEA